MDMKNLNCSRRSFLKVVSSSGAVVAASSCLGAQKQAKARSSPVQKPNVVLILVDDLGYGDLSCYGAKDLKTPHIDSLVAAGMRFDSFYANCPVCSPTRASLLTGRYPDMAGVPGVIRTYASDSWGYLSDKVTLLPRALKKQDYNTAIVGKWHLGLESPNKPNERGFDHFHGFLGDMMDNYFTHRRRGFNYMRLDNKKIDPKGHATDLFTQWSIDYIRSQKDIKKPFFLYLPYNAPHTPIQPPDKWLERVKKREKNINEKRAKLVALIEQLDDGIGKVIKSLKDTGQAGNTLVIFTSDNGGQLHAGADNGGLHGGKQEMWEGGIREPFCAVWPGKIPAGSRNRDCVALTMDLYPTICEAAGVLIDYEIDGRSFLQTLLGKKQSWPDRFIVWVRREGNRYGGRAYYAIRYGNWKLLQNSPFEPMQLFNLKDDPGEKNPLPLRHKMYGRLFKELRNHVTRAGAVPWEKYPVDVNKVYKG